MIYAWIGAIFIGVSLGLLGAGGSILTVPILVLLVHHPDKQAIAESLAVVGAVSLAGAIRNALRGNVEWSSILLFALPGMVGTYAGSWLAAYLPGALQILILAIVMLVSALMMAFSRVKERTDAGKRHPLLFVLPGVAIGAVTGLIGIGGGFLYVPALVLIARLPMKRAIGTSLGVIALSSASGFVKHSLTLSGNGSGVDWNTIVLFSVLGIAGMLVGSTFAQRINQRALKRLFACFLGVMSLYLIIKKWPEVMSPPATPPARQASAAVRHRMLEGRVDLAQDGHAQEPRPREHHQHD